MINKHTRINFTIIIVQFFLGSRGPNAEGAGETAKGKLLSEEKGLWPQPLRISLPCAYLVQILNLVSDWLRPWTSDLIGSLYQTGLTSHREALLFTSDRVRASGNRVINLSQPQLLQAIS